MLVLTRKEDEAISISPADGLDHTMTVAELFKGGPIRVIVDRTVKLGIEAPKGLLVVREELTDPWVS